jgi:hypothetical protein
MMMLCFHDISKSLILIKVRPWNSLLRISCLLIPVVLIGPNPAACKHGQQVDGFPRLQSLMDPYRVKNRCYG